MTPLLEVSGLSKLYGALVVTHDVSLTVHEREIHAIIGPNGAGKSTLIGQLAGEKRPDAGSIRFAGHDITHLPPQVRPRLGMARSYQIASLFDEMTVRQNVRLGIQACRPRAWSIGRPAGRLSELNEAVDELLEQVALEGRAERIVGTLSHGEKRKVELAMALACRPRLLLLDEPLAGMGMEEARSTVELLQVLKERYAILLIEHDMGAVFSLSDRISVLVYGRIIASGTREEIQRHPEVRRAYLGDAKEAA